MPETFEFKKPYDELSALKIANPFVPFAIAKNDGKRIKVDDWSQVALNESVIAVVDPLTLLKWKDVKGFEVEAPNPHYSQIVGLLRRRPFVPFAVVRKNGERYEVASRGRAGLSEITIGIAPPDSGLKIFQMDEVIGVEVHEAAN